MSDLISIYAVKQENDDEAVDNELLADWSIVTIEDDEMIIQLDFNDPI